MNVEPSITENDAIFDENDCSQNLSDDDENNSDNFADDDFDVDDDEDGYNDYVINLATCDKSSHKWKFRKETGELINMYYDYADGFFLDKLNKSSSILIK